jgi:uncharacterized protein YdeI (YjbR/CyaY-like superfamily)
VLDKPVVAFPTPRAWDAWLAKHHARSSGVWLRMAKKASGIPSVTYDEALDVALCWGWIDGLKKTYDAATWVQRFTPRTAKSVWSKRNRAKVAVLTRSGRMKPAGLEAVRAAKRDGRWQSAYDSPANARVPADLRAALAKNAAARASFATLQRRFRYVILYRVHSAKRPETRARRIAEFVQRLARGETVFGVLRPASEK